MKALFSRVKDFQTQPINYVQSGLPPFLLITGDKDKEVSPKNTINFANRLRQFKVSVTKIIYPGIGHIGIILSLASGFRYKASLLDDITDFIRSVNIKKDLDKKNKDDKPPRQETNKSGQRPGGIDKDGLKEKDKKGEI